MPDTLLPLALLACPIGMGVMMWMMSRDHKQPENGETKQAELASLQAQIDQLTAERANNSSEASRESSR